MCDSVVATGGWTASGATLFAKNSDRHEGECQPLHQVSAAAHAGGASVACTHIVIPQAARTHAVIGHSPWWVWGFEHGVNEHGVAIGNQSVFSREPVEDKPGLIGMDLVRLALERSRDAREALEMMTSLLERYGQGGSGFGPGEAGYHNSFTIADPSHAWLLETSGRHWAARRTKADALTNHITLGADWELGSSDLESFARSQGWWQGSERLHVSDAYRQPDFPPQLTSGRIRRSLDLLHASRGKHSVVGMKTLLRDHGRPAALPPVHAERADEARYTLCMHGEPVGTTTASLIAALPSDRGQPWPIWISFGSPCVGIFMPVYIAGEIPSPLRAGGETQPADGGASAWWLFHRLSRASAADFARFMPLARKAWQPLEEQISSERTAVERDAGSLLLDGAADEAAQRLSAFMARSWEGVRSCAEKLLATAS